MTALKNMKIVITVNDKKLYQGSIWKLLALFFIYIFFIGIGRALYFIILL